MVAKGGRVKNKNGSYALERGRIEETGGKEQGNVGSYAGVQELCHHQGHVELNSLCFHQGPW